MEYTDLYKDLSDESVFDSFAAAEPVAESLPHRGTPYEQTGISRNNPLLDYVSPDPNRYTPEMSENDANLLAEYNVGMMLAKMDMFVELGKGGIGEFLVSKDDLQILAEYQTGTPHDENKVRDILSRIEIKKEFENNKTESSLEERELVMKIAKNANLKKRLNGSLKMPTLEEVGVQMFLNKILKLSGNNPKIFGIIGGNIVKKVF